MFRHYTIIQKFYITHLFHIFSTNINTISLYNITLVCVEDLSIIFNRGGFVCDFHYIKLILIHTLLMFHTFETQTLYF